METAVSEIPDIRYIVAIMFGTEDLLTIKKILNKAGYPWGSGRRFAEQLRIVHEEWLKTGSWSGERDIEKVSRDYSGMYDPFGELEKYLAEKNKV